MLKLGLDVHLEFIMAVAQKDHAMPQAPRKFTNDELVAQVQRWEPHLHATWDFDVDEALAMASTAAVGTVLAGRRLMASATIPAARPAIVSSP